MGQKIHCVLVASGEKARRTHKMPHLIAQP
jgi:hypothetical protein